MVVRLQYLWYVLSGERRTDRLIERAIYVYDFHVRLFDSFKSAMEIIAKCLPKELGVFAKERQHGIGSVNEAGEIREDVWAAL